MTHSELVRLLSAARSARLERPAVSLALATLVSVEGSSYRQPGAMMLCDAEGRVLAGAISGGCLEQDVAVRAGDACETGRAGMHSYDLREDLETIWGFGTGCEGVAHVLLAPLPDLSALEAACDAARQRQHGTLLLTVQASDRGRMGTLAFAPYGPIAGQGASISPFMVESVSLAAARVEMTGLVLQTVQSTQRPFLATRSHEGTVVQLFGSPVRPTIQLVIVGASRGAESLAAIATASGWPVRVVDHRSAALEALSLPQGTERVVIDAHDAANAVSSGQLPGDARTAFALCTHRFEDDRAWIGALVPSQVPYVGVLGSRQRADRLIRAFAEADTPLRPRDRDRLFAPMGLDIGGESPDEIAMAAVSEIQAVLHARPGGSLRARQAPLHTRTDTPTINGSRAGFACFLPRGPVDATRLDERPPAAPPRRDRDRP